MNDLVSVIQQIVQNSLDAAKLTDLAYGVVKSTSPMRIQLDSTMQDIPTAAIVLTVGVKPKTAQVIGGAGGTVTINEGLATGDKVVMLRASKGQKYIVLSKV